MNIQYLQSVLDTCPQGLGDVFDCAAHHALVCDFNRSGSLLAIGCLDGNILLYDFIGKTLLQTIQAHSYFVSALAWSNKGDTILSCSEDCSISLWSIIDRRCLFRLNLFSPCPRHISFHPNDSALILIDFVQHYPILFNRNDYSTNRDCYQSLIDDASCSSPTDRWISTFNHDGEYTLTGNSQGRLLLFSQSKLIQSGMIDRYRTCPIKQISVSKQSKSIAVLTSERIRIYPWREIIERKPNKEYQCQYVLFDHVMKIKYAKMNFSGDGEYLCAISAREHRLYIWEIYSGSLMKILGHEHGKSLSDLIWHPSQSIIVSIADGIVYIWSRSDDQILSWNFQPIEENLIYHESENEFDRKKSALSVIGDEAEELIDVVSIRIPSDEEAIVWITADPISDEDDEEMNE